MDHVLYWLKHFAPSAIRFEVKKQVPRLKLMDDEKTVVQAFIKKSDDIVWNAENIHNLIYQVAEEQNIPATTIFTCMYQLLLGQKKGPRIGYFLSNLDKDFVLKRFQEAIR